MASKNSKKNKPLPKQRWYSHLKEETKRSILAIICLVLGLLFTLAAFGNAGIVGNSLYKIFEKLFGAGFFLVPIVFFIATISLITSFRNHFFTNTSIGGIFFLLSSLGAVEILFGSKTGGYVGYIISWPLLKLFDYWISLIILLALFIISFLIMFNTPIKINLKLKKEEKEEIEKEIKEAEIEKEEAIKENEEAGIKQSAIMASIKKIVAPKDKEEIELEKLPKIKYPHFTPPPLDLLETDKGKPSSGDIKTNSNIIKRTLQNFGIEVEMDEINIGPSVTQYTLKPAEGIKLSRILALQNDLSLALAAHPLRIEAPIPGRSLVGIEIPNSAKTIVGLANLFSEDGFQKSGNPLTLTLGRDVTGRAIFINLAKMPHLLIAGATGAGKSICIHSTIMSMLYKNSPESLRFIMIDPKRVELTIYNNIPHLLTPVITEPKKAIMALKWACAEMDKRYDTLLKAGVRDIASFHEKTNDYESMPYLIIIIDELADFMATYPREIESSIVRLAQMSRAVGIHLMVSTQRPSVEVITGLIKANITSRIALQVASQIDSRTILDMAGAEKLLGSGDMLYLAGDSAKPKRIQGPFISEKEIKNVVKFLANEYRDIDMEELASEETGTGITLEKALTDSKAQSSLELSFDNSDNYGNDDEIFEEAKEMVIKTGKASSSYLQRKFKIGYARAARLIDMLEEAGVVGPGDGAKPREVLIKNYDNSDYNNNDDL